MQRFFVTFPLGIDVTITDKDTHHQLTRVLRIQVGDHVVLFDGDGSETEYGVVNIDKKSITLRGKSQARPNTEPKKHVILYQAMPNKHEKIEYILQKWVEVGISRFIFFRSDRSQKLILSPAKIDRFITIAREAVEQCGGVVMPQIDFVEKSLLAPQVLDWFVTSQWQRDIVLDTTGILRRCSEFTDMQDIGLWVGPEGGWSDDERNKMSEKGFIFARFGERVLRTETAGIVTVFALLHA